MPSMVAKEKTLDELCLNSLKRTHELFLANYGSRVPVDRESQRLKLAVKINDEYATVKDLPPPPTAGNAPRRGPDVAGASHSDPVALGAHAYPSAPGVTLRDDTAARPAAAPGSQFALIANAPGGGKPTAAASSAVAAYAQPGAGALARASRPQAPKPQWHAPWKLMRVISGHQGWVRCVAVDSSNEWFCTGAADRTIKIWDLASGSLKLTLTGHISTVRGVAVSARHPYMFSCGEDKQVKCWDLEYNKVVRHYHGHLSGVYCLALHPTIDLLMTGGRDSACRVWDMRTKAEVHALVGHSNTVTTVACQAADPQVLTGSMDQTVKLWDLAAGKCSVTLTHHKKSVRSVVLHPRQYAFASASSDNIKQWACPKGEFLQNLPNHRSIINCLAINEDGVMVSGGDNGSMHFWDWRTGHDFFQTQAVVQPGSLDSEAGLYAMAFDKTGTRLITAEADKTIKIYKEDEDATPESHPVVWKPVHPGARKGY